VYQIRPPSNSLHQTAGRLGDITSGFGPEPQATPGGFAGLHAATCTDDDWTWFSRMIGGRFAR